MLVLRIQEEQYWRRFPGELGFRRDRSCMFSGLGNGNCIFASEWLQTEIVEPTRRTMLKEQQVYMPKKKCCV